MLAQLTSQAGKSPDTDECHQLISFTSWAVENGRGGYDRYHVLHVRLRLSAEGMATKHVGSPQRWEARGTGRVIWTVHVGMQTRENKMGSHLQARTGTPRIGAGEERERDAEV